MHMQTLTAHCNWASAQSTDSVHLASVFTTCIKILQPAFVPNTYTLLDYAHTDTLHCMTIIALLSAHFRNCAVEFVDFPVNIGLYTETEGFSLKLMVVADSPRPALQV